MGYFHHVFNYHWQRVFTRLRGKCLHNHCWLVKQEVCFCCGHVNQGYKYRCSKGAEIRLKFAFERSDGILQYMSLLFSVADCISFVFLARYHVKQRSFLKKKIKIYMTIVIRHKFVVWFNYYLSDIYQNFEVNLNNAKTLNRIIYFIILGVCTLKSYKDLDLGRMCITLIIISAVLIMCYHWVDDFRSANSWNNQCWMGVLWANVISETCPFAWRKSYWLINLVCLCNEKLVYKLYTNYQLIKTR